MSFQDNAARRRYELIEDGFTSFADYRDVAGVRVIMHVETPDEAQGRGFAAKLMNNVVAHSRAGGPKLRASCSYAVAYFRRHPDAGDVLA